MRLRHFAFGSLAALILAVSAPAQKQDKKNGQVVPTVDSDNLAAGDYAGKLLSTPGTDGTFMVEIQVPKLQLKAGNKLPNGNKYANIAREQQKVTQLQNQLASAKNQQQYLQKYNQLQAAIAQLQRSVAQAGLQNQSPYTVTYDKKDVTFHAGEDYKVRRLELPVQFDDKGEPKKYTEEEKKELKGKDKNLPGYEAKPDDLTTGQVVKVTIARNKKKPAPKEAADKEDKTDKDKKDDEPKMVATLIVILSEPADNSTTPKGKGKKNNN